MIEAGDMSLQSRYKIPANSPEFRDRVDICAPVLAVVRQIVHPRNLLTLWGFRFEV